MRARTLFLATAVIAVMALPASANDFSLFGSYWDTDVAGDAGGGGLGLGFAINDYWSIDLRAQYFEELTDDPLRNAFDSDDPVFQRKGIQALPAEVGARVTFGPDASVRPYVGAGLSYFFLDSDFGEINDELGWYALVGATFGDQEGAQFFVEGTWRKAEAQVELDPDDLDDIDDIGVADTARFDIDGFGVNAGVRWSF
jgi:hypothetical protein